MNNIKKPKARCDIILGKSIAGFLNDLYKSIKDAIIRKIAEIIIKLDNKLYPSKKYITPTLIMIDPNSIFNNKLKL